MKQKLAKFFNFIFKNFYAQTLFSSIKTYLQTYFPRLYKIFFYLNNFFFNYLKYFDFFFTSFRYYFYITIFLYGFVFTTITLILMLNYENLFPIIDYLIMSYKIWTYPIKKIRFLVKYIFYLLIFFKVIKTLFLFVKKKSEKMIL